MRAYRLARGSEIVYAAIQAGFAYYIPHALRAVGHPLSPRSLLVGWTPVAVALVLAAVLRPGARWAWWAAAVLALYVIWDSAVAAIRLANLPVGTWPTGAWIGFGMMGVRLLTQILVLSAALLALRRRSVATSPAG